MPRRIVPQSTSDDSDDVAVALETARVEEERGDSSEAARWLQRAAAAARTQGRPNRAGELSRAAAQLARHGKGEAGQTEDKFEKRPDQEQVFADIEEDDFSDETIVDEPPQPKRQDAETDRIVSEATPIAPGAQPEDLPIHRTVRVAVRRSLGGKLEARPLDSGESASEGEEEAFLVPSRAGVKIW